MTSAWTGSNTSWSRLPAVSVTVFQPPDGLHVTELGRTPLQLATLALLCVVWRNDGRCACFYYRAAIYWLGRISPELTELQSKTIQLNTNTCMEWYRIHYGLDSHAVGWSRSRGLFRTTTSQRHVFTTSHSMTYFGSVNCVTTQKIYQCERLQQKNVLSINPQII